MWDEICLPFRPVLIVTVEAVFSIRTVVRVAVEDAKIGLIYVYRKVKNQMMFDPQYYWQIKTDFWTSSFL